jgi:hypothetical protein
MKTRQRDWAQVVGEYERSGLSQEAFAQKKGVKVWSLRYWIYKERRKEQGRVGLVPITLTGSTSGHFEGRTGVVYRHRTIERRPPAPHASLRD